MNRALFFFVIALATSPLACKKRLEHADLTDPQNRLQKVAPTKDEIALINGVALGLTEYLTFVERLKQNGSKADAKTALKIAQTSILLASVEESKEAKQSNAPPLTPEDLIGLSRFAWRDLGWGAVRESVLRHAARYGLRDDEASSRERLNDLFSKASIIENPIALQALL